MKPAPFDLERPGTVDEAVALLGGEEVESRPLAGGQSLVPLLNFRLSRPETLVSLNGIAELAALSAEDGELVIGAMVRQRTAETSPVVRGWCPLLVEALGQVAHLAIRNRGTVGGSIAHADPSAELPAAALALDATMVLRGAGSGSGAGAGSGAERRVAARDFFLGPYMTDLNPGELLVAVRVPRPAPGSGSAAVEVARRQGDFALAGAMVQLVVAGGLVAHVRLAFFGLAARPVLAEAAASLVGTEPAPPAIDRVARAAAAGLSPTGDLHASSRFRSHLAEVVSGRALRLAVERATTGTRPTEQERT